MSTTNNQQTDYITPAQTMTPAERQWQQLWQDIENAGGRYQYIQQQMVQHGFMVERKPIDNMSPKERERYKKSLKKEAAEEKNLKKIAWQAYKAQHIVYLGRHIYWSDDTSIDKWDTKDASNRLIENKLPLISKHTQLASAVNLTVPQLKGLCYQQEVASNIPYTHFTINKRNGTPRQIWSPIPRLKFVQRWILENILNNLMTHGAAHGFVRGKSIVTNATVHCNSALLIKLDVKDFFPSVHWRRVKGVFRHAGYPEQIATLLALLCTESPRQMVQQNGKTYYVALSDRALPQGAPTSPALTNIVCLNLDRRLTGLAEKIGLRYSRYADDLTFSLPANSTSIKNAAQPSDHNHLIGQLLGSVHKILQEEGFILNNDKTRVIRMGNQHNVTGMVVNGEGVPRVPRKIKRMLRASLHNLALGQPLREGETLETLSGYAAWIASAERELGETYLEKLAVLQDQGKLVEIKGNAATVNTH
ncbi:MULTISPECIES: reverse transcriptase family protein [Psychrobacter]|uniref:reverse transcriptase family protein n=1 Tax=Psychrobacter TaxID=497 RepID=UPI001919FD9F|nr:MULTISPECIES: reverse transcriptase family protein [Psychrobacter]MBP7955981.1 RNA-directed DNA polymerase [Psychrobacter sp.]MBP8032119.1 RNA-directed DNA polymerase [Psychrobacter sp.]